MFLFLHASNVLSVQICPTRDRVGAFSADPFTAKHPTMLGLFGVSLSTRRPEKNPLDSVDYCRHLEVEGSSFSSASGFAASCTAAASLHFVTCISGLSRERPAQIRPGELKREKGESAAAHAVLNGSLVALRNRSDHKPMYPFEHASKRSSTILHCRRVASYGMGPEDL